MVELLWLLWACGGAEPTVVTPPPPPADPLMGAWRIDLPRAERKQLEVGTTDPLQGAQITAFLTDVDDTVVRFGSEIVAVERGGDRHVRRWARLGPPDPDGRVPLVFRPEDPSDPSEERVDALLSGPADRPERVVLGPRGAPPLHLVRLEEAR